MCLELPVSGLVFLAWSVCRVFLLEVEQAACKKSQLSSNPGAGERYWGYMILSQGAPNEQYHSLSPAREWNWEIGSKVKICMQFRLPINSKILCWLGWSLFWMTLISPFSCESLCLNNIFLEIACQPTAVFRVGNKAGARKGNQSISNLHFET